MDNLASRSEMEGRGAWRALRILPDCHSRVGLTAMAGRLPVQRVAAHHMMSRNALEFEHERAEGAVELKAEESSPVESCLLDC